MNRHSWDRRQSGQVKLLTSRRVWIYGTRYACGVIVDCLNSVSCWKDVGSELVQVKPLTTRSPDRVVEVETIDIDDGLQDGGLQSAVLRKAKAALEKRGF